MLAHASPQTRSNPSARMRALRTMLVAAMTAAFLVVPEFALDAVRAVAAPHPVTPVITAAALKAGPTTGPLADSTGAPSLVSDESTIPSAVTLIGVSWSKGALPAGAVVEYRTFHAGTWGAWQPAPMEQEGPDGAEAAGARSSTAPIAVVRATKAQARIRGIAPGKRADARLNIIDPGTSAADATVGTTASGAAQAAAVRPEIYTRAQWGADESLRNPANLAYGRVELAVVHHTVDSNSYQPGDVPALLRGILAYHTKVNGWSDMGYNFVVDRFGRIWEGRFGGTDEAVSGAHAYNHNSISTGISALGNYDLVAVPDAVVDAMARLIAWKFTLHGIPVRGQVNPQLPVVYGERIIGHRDGYGNSTACPGRYLYAQLPTIRARAAAYQGGLVGNSGHPRPLDGTYTFNGRGVGPGRGMSLWGAKAMAEAGQSWQQILDLSYPGSLRSTAQPLVRVGLDRLGTGPLVYALTPGFRFTIADAVPNRTVPVGAGYLRVRAEPGGLTLETATSAAGPWSVFLTSQPSPFISRDLNGPIAVMVAGARHPYRGDLVVWQQDAGHLLAVNHIMTEQLVAGTLGDVMPVSWPLASTQALAVAVRSFALRQVWVVAGAGRYDLADDWIGYAGVTAEHATALQAVQTTSQAILTFEGYSAYTYWTASDGGIRASGGFPYLRAQADPWDDDSPNNPARWSRQIPVQTIERAFPGVGSLRTVTILGQIGNGSWGERPGSVLVEGSTGAVAVAGDTFRTAIGLPSTWYTIAPE